VYDCAQNVARFHLAHGESFDPGANGSGGSAFSRTLMRRERRATPNDRLNADPPEPLAPGSNEEQSIAIEYGHAVLADGISRIRLAAVFKVAIALTDRRLRAEIHGGVGGERA